MRPRHALTLLILLFDWGLAGCRDSPKLVPVSGTVTLDGKPLEGATISFLPDAQNQVATHGRDVTGASGNYIAFHRGRNGLAPGLYKVVVTKGGPESKLSTPPSDSYDPILDATREETKRHAGIRVASTAKELAITGEFSREVGDQGGIIDVDVKASTKLK